MKKHKILLSVFMVIIIISISVIPSFATEKKYTTEKLDTSLLTKLEKADDNEKFTVSVWFDDLDKEKIKEKLHTKCSEYKNAEIYEKTEELLFGEICDVPVGYTGDYLSYAKEYYKEVTQNDFQYISEKKREVFRNEYTSHNQDRLNEIKDILGNNQKQAGYVSKYSPNIELELSKEEILKIAEISSVKEIYLADIGFQQVQEERTVPADNEEDEEEEPTYDYSFYHVTGLDSGRDALHLNGSGMKVGVIEENGDCSFGDLQNDNIVDLTPVNTQSLHARQVVGLMVSNRDDFLGAIPQAQLFFTKITSVKSAVESLLNQGVVAINASFSYSIQYDTYGDTAKWYDHIAIQHNVHLILASSNWGSSGVPYTNTSFNAIVVGNCDNNGVIDSDSSYSSGEEMKYKPDIVAPGVNIATPVYNGSGTSYSAPLVTSAVVQLAQASPILAANPTLMKSLLLSSSKMTSDMIANDPVYSIAGSSDIALSRKYGAGMLNLTRAYTSFMTNGNYITGALSSHSLSANYNRNITKVANKTLRFCLTWEKLNSIDGDHISNEVNSLSLDNLRLTVVTPSGVTYTSSFMYDNKQMITINATENGYYFIRVQRVGTAEYNHNVGFAVTYSAY